MTSANHDYCAADDDHYGDDDSNDEDNNDDEDDHCCYDNSGVSILGAPFIYCTSQDHLLEQSFATESVSRRVALQLFLCAIIFAGNE